MPVWKGEPGHWMQSERRKLRDGRQKTRLTSLYLDQLGKGEEATWNQIAAHIQKRQPNEYNKAVTLLTDLLISRSGKAG